MCAVYEEEEEEEEELYHLQHFTSVCLARLHERTVPSNHQSKLHVWQQQSSRTCVERQQHSKQKRE